MKRWGLSPAVALLIAAVIATLAVGSCTTPGIGVGMDYPSRWSSGAGPPIFVGSPAP